MVLNYKSNSVSNEVNNEMAKPVSNVQNTSNNWLNGVKPQELAFNIHENMPSFNNYNLSNTSGSILTNESPSSFRQFPWKTFIITLKYFKKWLFGKQKSHLKKYLDNFESKIHKFMAGKKNTSTFFNETIDCTNEFIYICSESKPINSLLLNRSQYLPALAFSYIPHWQLTKDIGQENKFAGADTQNMFQLSICNDTINTLTYLSPKINVNAFTI